MIDEIQAISDAICEYLRPHYSLHTVDITTRCRNNRSYSRIYVSNYPKRNRLGKNRFSQFYIALYSDKAITVMQEAVNTDLVTLYADPDFLEKINEFIKKRIK